MYRLLPTANRSNLNTSRQHKLKLKDFKSDIKLTKVDAIEQVKFEEKHKIHGFLTLKFFSNGKPSDYNGK